MRKTDKHQRLLSLLFIITMSTHLAASSDGASGSSFTDMSDAFFPDQFFQFTDFEDSSEKLSEDLLSYLSELRLPPEQEYLDAWKQLDRAEQRFIKKMDKFLKKAGVWLEDHSDLLTENQVPEFDEFNEINNQGFDEFRAKEEQSPFMKISTLYTFLLSSELACSNHLNDMTTRFFKTEYPQFDIPEQLTESLTRSKNPEKFQETVTYIASLAGLMVESPTLIRFKSEYVKTQKHFLIKETETLNHWIQRIDSGLQLLKKKL